MGASPVNVLARIADHAEVYQPASGLQAEEVGRLERYLDAVRSTLLFAKGVMLVEGDAELIMIPAMLRSVFGVTPDELGFSIVSMSSAFFEHVAVLFHKDRIRRPCAILTDLDQSLIDLPINPQNDTKEEERARAAQTSGEGRQMRLDSFTTGNRWVRSFFADHTFEVDFVAAGNVPEVVRTLDVLYKKPEHKAKSTQLLESDVPRQAGKEILRLANRYGKGWFALLLSEKIDPWTYFPEYILRGVAFACRACVNEGALRRIAEFRIKEQGSGGVAKDLPPSAELKKMNTNDFLAAYRSKAPKDELSWFCAYIDEYRKQ